MEAVKDSLRRLRTDYIDLYQLHGGTMEDPIDETIEAFERLKEQGWIRLRDLLDPPERDSRVRRAFQYRQRDESINSILDRRAEEAVIPLLQEHGISIIARGPLAKGIRRTARDKAAGGFPLCGGGAACPARSAAADRREQALLNAYGASLLHGSAGGRRDAGGRQLRRAAAENAAASQAPPLTEEELGKIRSVSKANRYAEHR